MGYRAQMHPGLGFALCPFVVVVVVVTVALSSLNMGEVTAAAKRNKAAMRTISLRLLQRCPRINYQQDDTSYPR
jgi:hypothetical protein